MIDQLSKQLQEEKARITEARLLAWSSLGMLEEIAGVEVYPLTARAWIDLQLTGNALFGGGDIELGDLLNYIWRNSKGYTIGKGAKRRKKAIGRAVERKGLAPTYLEALAHIKGAFEELPRSLSTGGFFRSNTMAPVEGIVGALDEVAHRYGQDPAVVADWPLNRLFQLQKSIRLATIPEYKLLEPESVHAIKRQILINLNNDKS